MKKSVSETMDRAKYRHDAFTNVVETGNSETMNGMRCPCGIIQTFNTTYGAGRYVQLDVFTPNYSRSTSVTGGVVADASTLITLPTKFEHELLQNEKTRTAMYTELGVIGGADGMRNTTLETVVELVNRYILILPRDEQEEI